MWTAVFSIAFVIAVGMSVAAVLVQSDCVRLSLRRRPGASPDSMLI